MDARKIIFIYEKNSSDTLCNELTQYDWSIYLTNKMSSARDLCDKHHFLVGLVFIDKDASQAYLKKLDDLFNYSTAAHWIILISPEQLNTPSLLSYEKQLIRDYCYDFHTLPIDIEKLLFTLGHAHGMSELIKKPFNDTNNFSMESNMIGESPAMLNVFNQIKKIAQYDHLLLIEGETGVGKQMTARYIHKASDRSDKPFVEVNCGMIDENKFEEKIFLVTSKKVFKEYMTQ